VLLSLFKIVVIYHITDLSITDHGVILFSMASIHRLLVFLQCFISMDCSCSNPNGFNCDLLALVDVDILVQGLI
jgi:hypothetical protein